MSTTFVFHESDWKLYRQKLPQWQEAYMDRLNKEYIALLSGPELPSRKFWALEERIFRDKKKPGVICERKRSNMSMILDRLLADGVITLDDLDGFSSDLRECLASWVATAAR